MSDSPVKFYGLWMNCISGVLKRRMNGVDEMKNDRQVIGRADALKQIRLTIQRMGILYQCFNRTLVDEFGEKRGGELIEKAVGAYEDLIGETLKDKLNSTRLLQSRCISGCLRTDFGGRSDPRP
jgi:hypothetical protein